MIGLEHRLIHRYPLIFTEEEALGRLNIKLQMDTMGELLPFAKEMLRQRPTAQMLKIYVIGSTVAVLGVIGGLVELFFSADDQEDTGAELWLEQEQLKQKNMEKTETALMTAEDVHNTVLVDTKTSHLIGCRRSSANRLHAS